MRNLDLVQLTLSHSVTTEDYVEYQLDVVVHGTGHTCRVEVPHDGLKSDFDRLSEDLVSQMRDILEKGFPANQPEMYFEYLNRRTNT